MSSFTYINGIPAAANNPSTDQPNMLTNTNSIPELIAVDHVSFNATNGGTHLQVTLATENTPGAQTDPQSVIFSGAGSANTIAELFYKNASGTLLLSGIKAFGVFTTSGSVGSGTVTAANYYNINPTISYSNGTYTVTLTSGVTTGNNAVVIVVGQRLTSYSFAGGVITVVASASVAGVIYFVVLQA
jgi:hypothetical protein